MKPSELSSALRHIAAKLDRSTRPDPNKVRMALQEVIAQMAPEEAQQQQQGQQQQQALPQSGPGKANVKAMLDAAVEAFENNNHEEFMKNIEKLSKTPSSRLV